MKPTPRTSLSGWLRLARGPADFFVPAAWIVRVDTLERPSPLPQAEPWVLGLAPVGGDRWLPVFDLLTAIGAQSPRYGVAALLAPPHAPPLAWCLTDKPGALATPPPSTGHAHPRLPWLLPLETPDPARSNWMFDAPAWAASLAPL